MWLTKPWQVSGVVALMLNACPNLTYADVAAVLFSTDDRSSLGLTGYTCGGTPDLLFPNNQYGYGRVNALAAVNKILGDSSSDACTNLEA